MSDTEHQKVTASASHESRRCVCEAATCAFVGTQLDRNAKRSKSVCAEGRKPVLSSDETWNITRWYKNGGGSSKLELVNYTSTQAAPARHQTHLSILSSPCCRVDARAQICVIMCVMLFLSPHRSVTMCGEVTWRTTWDVVLECFLLCYLSSSPT